MSKEIPRTISYLQNRVDRFTPVISGFEEQLAATTANLGNGNGPRAYNVEVQLSVAAEKGELGEDALEQIENKGRFRQRMRQKIAQARSLIAERQPEVVGALLSQYQTVKEQLEMLTTELDEERARFANITAMWEESRDSDLPLITDEEYEQAQQLFHEIELRLLNGEAGAADEVLADVQVTLEDASDEMPVMQPEVPIVTDSLASAAPTIAAVEVVTSEGIDRGEDLDTIIAVEIEKTSVMETPSAPASQPEVAAVDHAVEQSPSSADPGVIYDEARQMFIVTVNGIRHPLHLPAGEQAILRYFIDHPSEQLSTNDLRRIAREADPQYQPPKAASVFSRIGQKLNALGARGIVVTTGKTANVRYHLAQSQYEVVDRVPNRATRAAGLGGFDDLHTIVDEVARDDEPDSNQVIVSKPEQSAIQASVLTDEEQVVATYAQERLAQLAAYEAQVAELRSYSEDAPYLPRWEAGLAQLRAEIEADSRVAEGQILAERLQVAEAATQEIPIGTVAAPSVVYTTERRIEAQQHYSVTFPRGETIMIQGREASRHVQVIFTELGIGDKERDQLIDALFGSVSDKTKEQFKGALVTARAAGAGLGYDINQLRSKRELLQGSQALYHLESRPPKHRSGQSQDGHVPASDESSVAQPVETEPAVQAPTPVETVENRGRAITFLGRYTYDPSNEELQRLAARLGRLGMSEYITTRQLAKHMLGIEDATSYEQVVKLIFELKKELKEAEVGIDIVINVPKSIVSRKNTDPSARWYLKITHGVRK